MSLCSYSVTDLVNFVNVTHPSAKQSRINVRGTCVVFKFLFESSVNKSYSPSSSPMLNCAPKGGSQQAVFYDFTVAYVTKSR